MRLPWRSSYKLPISFIIFFVLVFFLFGEQLVALPLYLNGPIAEGSTGPDKLHILDLPPGDALHRPIAYLVIGIIIWVLFRIFVWPVAWILGAVLWALEQLTLTPLDQRPSISNILVFTFTFWILLTLVPYFVYRWVDSKWGGQGKRSAILIAASINLLLFSFFAFQIYVLHHSYRGRISSSSTPTLPPNICPERLVAEKDKQTTAFWDGKILLVSGEVQNWVEENCPEALEKVK